MAKKPRLGRAVKSKPGIVYWNERGLEFRLPRGVEPHEVRDERGIPIAEPPRGRAVPLLPVEPLRSTRRAIPLRQAKPRDWYWDQRRREWVPDENLYAKRKRRGQWG